MFKRKRTRLISLMGVLGLTFLIGGVSLFAGTSVANAAEMTADDLTFVTESMTGPGLLGEGYLAHGGWGDRSLRGIDYQALLADALGITVKELEAAYEEARTAAIELAVMEGVITQEQADEMTVWGGKGGRGFSPFSFGRKSKDVSSDKTDEGALLAEALEITVEELQAARKAANAAAIVQAVEEGIITQEQADEMQARKDLQSYLSRDALLAQALGISAQDLEDAYAEGKTLSDLLSDAGLDAATVRDSLASAYEEALGEAVADGVSTQEQADETQDGTMGVPGFGRMPGRGGRGSMRGRGEVGDKRPCAPDSDDETSGTRLRRPRQATQGDSAL